jgi:hypothetical protein
MRLSVPLKKVSQLGVVPWGRRLQALCLAYLLFFSAVLAGAHALPAFAHEDASLHQILCGTDAGADQTPIHDHDGNEFTCCVPALSAVLPLPSFHAERIDVEPATLNAWLPASHNPVAGYPLSAPGMLRAPPLVA